MDGPHQTESIRQTGTALSDAEAAIVFVHGRGATAQSILELHDQIGTEGVAALAPQAAGRSWYPNSFLRPVAENEPGRSSGLQAIADTVARTTDAGIPKSNVLLVGFSQGACLASEFLARRPDRFGGLAALSGGLIGPEIDPTSFDGDLAGTPVFLGCSDTDPYIPVERVEVTASVFESLGGAVTTEFYPDRPHGIYEEELTQLAELVVTISQ